MQEIHISGSLIKDEQSFYEEIQRRFCPNLKGMGHNLAALNDVLRGGFGVHEYDAPVKVIWDQSAESRTRLDDPIYPEFVEASKRNLLSENPPDLKIRVEELSKSPFTFFDAAFEVMAHHDSAKLGLR